MVVKTQDLPPPGGYQKIDFKRIPARKYFSGYQWILGYIGKICFLLNIAVIQKNLSIILCRDDGRSIISLLS